MRTRHLRFLILSAALFVVARDAHAQGYGVYEQSACMMGRGGAGVASPCDDGSAVYYNPAGIVLTPGQVVSVGATIIGPRGHFTDQTTGLVSTLNTRYYPVPDVFYKDTFGGGRVAAGIGFFAPYGLTTDWPTTAQGRFLGYKSLVHSFYFQPTVAVKLGGVVSVGGGIDITRTNVELRQHLDLATVPISNTPYTFGMLGVPAGTDFADVGLTGDAWHAGYHLGVIVAPTKAVSIGARYMSGQRVDITAGSVAYAQISTGLVLPVSLGPLPAGTPIDTILAPKFSGAGPFISQTATTSIPLPDQFVGGIAVRVTPRLQALVDYQFVRWAMFDALVVTQSVAGTQNTIESYQNTSGVRAGIDYAVSDRTAVRFGFDVHGAAAPPQTVTPNLPEGAREEFSAGFGRKFGRASLDAYYLYLHQGDRAGRTVGPPSGQPATTALNNGTYSFMANLFGVTFAVAF